jgi:hypothetical protein
VKIVRDVPGSRLLLEAPSERHLPLLLWGGLVILGALAALLLPLKVAWHIWTGQTSDIGGEMGVALAGLFVAFILVFVLGPSRKLLPFRVDIDRTAGEVLLVRRRAVGPGLRETVVPLAQVRRVRLATVRRSGGIDPFLETALGKGLHLRLTLEAGREGSDRLSRHEMKIAVADLDQSAEVVDLAYRVGAACGLPFSRIVRNDVRVVEVELCAAREPGFAPSPFTLARADYARDAVAPAAHEAVSEEKVPAFEPAAFPSDHKVAVYEPGRSVVFRRPLRLGVMIGCLPFTLLLLLGPAVFVATGYIPNMTIGPRLVTSFLALVFGLIFGAVAVAAVRSGLPRTVSFDWSTRRVTSTAGPAFDLSFEGISAVELREVHRASRSKNSTTHWYHCEIVLKHRGGGAETAEPTIVVETRHLIDDPDTPFRATLPLATELARALGVPRRLSEG